MKKVLLATAIAAVSTTAAMADVSISDYQEGKVHALMQTANTFEARGINIVENSNKIAVHKTVNAWNQEWNALEGENTVDLDAIVSVTTLYTASHGVITVETDNIDIAADGQSAEVTNALGDVYTIQAADVYVSLTQNISARDSRAAEVSVEESMSLSDSVGSVGEIVDEVVISISGVGVQISSVDSFDVISDKVENAVQNSCLLYTSPSPRDRQKSRMPSSA